MKKTILILAGLLSLNLSAAVPPPEKLLPANTFGFLTVPDANALRGAGEASASSKMWNDPAMAAFAKKVEDGLREMILDPLREQAGIEPAEYLELAQGQVTVALTDSLFDRDLPGLLLLVDSAKKADALEGKLKKLRDTLREQDQPFAKRLIRGVEFTAIRPPAEGPEILIGLSDTLLVMGINDRDVEKVLVAQAGGGVKALSGRPSYMRRHNAQFRNALGFGWLDFSTVLEKILAEVEERAENDDPDAGNPLGITPDGVITAIGLKGIQAISVSYHSDGGDLLEVSVDAPKAQRLGLLKMAASGAGEDASPPAFVGENVMTFGRSRANLQQIWNDLEKMLGDISPQAQLALGLVEQAVKNQDPDFRLKEDFINTLGDDLITLGWAPEGNDLEALASAPTVYLIKSNKPQTTIASILTIASLGLPAPEKREFLGRTIHSFEFGGGFDNEAPQMGLHLSNAGGYLVMTDNRKALEDYLRGPGENQKPLAAKQQLKAAAERIGGMKTGSFSYQNDAKIVGMLFGAVRNNPDLLDAILGAIPNNGGGPDLDWLDFKLLPEFKKVRKYFNFSLYTIGADDQSIRLRLFSPTPPGLE